MGKTKKELMEEIPAELAVIACLPGGGCKIFLLSEKIPDEYNVVALWNGEEWIDLERLKKAALKSERNLIDEWAQYIENWIMKNLEILIEAAKNNWERFLEIWDSLKEEHATNFNIEEHKKLVEGTDDSP